MCPSEESARMDFGREMSLLRDCETSSCRAIAFCKNQGLPSCGLDDSRV